MTGSPGMIGRISLAAVGVACGLWGVWLLWDNTLPEQWPALFTWLVGGVVLHDAVLVPVVLLLGWVSARLMPRWLRGPVVVGALLLGVLTIAAVPVLGGWGRRPDNPSLLDRDYPAGWLVVAVLVGLGVLAAVVRSRQVASREGETSEEEGDRGERARRR